VFFFFSCAFSGKTDLAYYFFYTFENVSLPFAGHSEGLFREGDAARQINAPDGKTA
jgi:hypothetical protein